MATASPIEGRIPHVLQCPICLETLRRPKLLPCGHTYCASCLQSHINSTMINRGTLQTCFSCSVCRVDTTLPDTAISVDQWAESFPVNSIVSSVLDVTYKMHSNKLCDICQKWNIQTTAATLCKDCEKFMCKICREHHNENQLQLEHDVIDLNSENTSCITIPKLSIIEICSRHRKKCIEFFCRDHSSLCCSTCGFLEHRKCEGVITIDDMFRTFDMGTKSNDLEANLRNIGSHLKQMISKVKENADSIKTDKSAILQQICNMKSELNVQLRELENDLVASLEGNYKSEDLNLQNQEARCNSLITAIENDLTQYDLVMTHGTEAQKVIMIHNMEKNQNIYLKVMSEYEEDIRDVKIGLDINTRLKDLIKELTGFGLIKVTRTIHDLPSCLIVTPSAQNVEVVSGSTRTPLKDRKALKGTKNILVDYDNSRSKVDGEKNYFLKSRTLQGRIITSL
ncbi:hypothetical protein CHS0354_007386 [Potamilus streckersoni]|uniref:Uncharacterized protein n=1 Tax=Potamilus streckersoni TaxID=2493646 RepID=A0AAE0TE52_9BIVA|nr:hypothetical protein CHS0354_007386 [Potamilus streckersoni]